MEINFGQSLRNIREAKNLSLAQAAKGVLSNAQLSKFERGDSDLTISKMLQILANINVSIEEFDYVSKNYQLTGFDKLLRDIQFYYTNNDIEKIQELKLVELEAGRRLNAIMIDAIAYGVTRTIPLKQEDKDYLSDYLFSVSEWGYYELALFSNSITSLTVETLDISAKEMLNKTEFYRNLPHNRKMLTQTLINVIIIMINEDSLQKAKYFLEEVGRLITEEVMLYEKNVFLFVHGYYLFKDGNQQSGKEKMKKSIEVFHLLGSPNLAANYQTFYDSLFHI